MRALALAFLMILLPGCLQGDTGSGATPTFPVSCPNWTLGQHPVFSVGDSSLLQGAPGQTTKTTVNLVPDSAKGPARPPPDENGKKVDQYRLEFPMPGNFLVHVENGTLEFRAFRNDTGAPLQLYDPKDPGARQDAWTFPSGYSGGATLQADLVPSTRDPSPAALRLEATFTASPGHVIGTGTQGPNSRAGAVFSFRAFATYRAPGCVAP